MEWLFGLAFLPLLLCGLMCAVPMVLAAVGMRRSAARRACCDDPDTGASGSDRDHAVLRR